MQQSRGKRQGITGREALEERPPISPSPEIRSDRRRWHFANAVLDERTLDLIVNGSDAELERRPLEVLLYLLQHAGEVCTKDELLAGVWPGRVLSETVLTKCIGRLREALGDRDQDIIKTAYGYGYRLVAPVRVELVAAPERARFAFQPGDAAHGRPLWSLVERLGAGGHGEAWRVRHVKTREQRVFKFALDESSLVALKREITLFRVINDTLGENAAVVKLLDWNLEQFPYFVEAEYIAGGNLLDWVQGRGGIDAIPLAERLEIVARLANALAAIHSVGVLHKDVKPSNVMVRPVGPHDVEILLADFGSGAVLDGDRLERLGITRLGFTKTLAVSEALSSTPLYLAPEVLLGQPFTVKTDLYALGVILYQFLAGDFHKVMSPGWERGIEDELLREDLALLADGNPAMRLSDAEVLARRLRTLDERRRALAEKRETDEKAERTRRMLERARARRFGLAVAFGVLLVGLAVSTALYLKTREAQAHTAVAAAQAKAVVEFLSRDVFAPVSSGKESVKDMNVVTLLSRAGQEVDSRFAGQPQLASELHFVLGRSLNALNESPRAVRHLNRSMELGEHLDGEGAESALRSASALISLDYAVGHLRDTLGRYRSVLSDGEKRLGPDARTVLELHLTLTRGDYLLGNWAQAAQEMPRLLEKARAGGSVAPAFIAENRFYYGQMLTDLARPEDARKQLEIAIQELTTTLGESHGLVAEARAALGRALSEAGRYAEADAELQRAQDLATRWAAAESWTEIRPRYFRALLFLHQDRPERAEPILADLVRYQDENIAAYLAANQDAGVQLDHTGAARQALGETYARQGKIPQAIATLQKSVSVGETADGAQHPRVMSARLSLAETFLMAGQDEEARLAFQSVSTNELARIPANHPLRAQWNRVKGLLAQRQNEMAESRKALRAAFEIWQASYGPSHWRTVRAHEELQRASLRKDGSP
jgi:non-specific serine/threonine protein kinase